MSKVFSTSRLSIHTEWGAYGAHIPPEDLASFPTRFMVIRDPFSRLLSSYLDKAYLPDHWDTWMVKFSKLVQRRDDNDFLRRHFDHLHSTLQPTDHGTPLSQSSGEVTNSTFGEMKCGKYLTFKQYVDVAVNHRMYEPHLMPIHKVCNPCKLNVTHVNVMSSFNSDARNILQKMSVGNLLNNWNSTTQVII